MAAPEFKPKDNRPKFDPTGYDPRAAEESLLNALGQAATEFGHDRYGNAAIQADRQNRSRSAIGGLSNAFIEGYRQKFGKNPTVDEIQEFVGSQTTPEFARKIVEQGTLSPESYGSQFVDPFFKGRDEENRFEDIYKNMGDFNLGDYISQLNESVQGQRGGLSDIYASEESDTTNKINDLYNQQRIRTVNDLAALGATSQPSQYQNLASIEGERNRSLSDALSQLRGNRGQARVGLESNLQNMIQGGRQFGANFGLNRAGAQSDLLSTINALRTGKDASSFQRNMLERQGLADNIFRNAQLAEQVRSRVDRPNETMSDIAGWTGILGGLGQAYNSAQSGGEKAGENSASAGKGQSIWQKAKGLFGGGKPN